MHGSFRVVLFGVVAFLLTACQSPTVGTGGVVQGVAVFGDQTAHGGISIALLGTDKSATTDDSGSFTIGNVGPGTYKLEARFPDYQKGTVGTVIVVDGETTQVPPLVLARDSASGTLAALKGVIRLGGGGASSGGVLVFLEGSTLAAFTASTGDFKFDRVPAGTHTLVASLAGYQTLRVEGVAVPATGTIDLGTLTLSPSTGPTGGISGAVTLSGTAGAGVTVFLAGTSLSALTDGAGRYAISGALPGTYDLNAAKPGFVTRSLPALVVRAGEVTSAGTLDLLPIGPGSSPFGRLVGKVTKNGALTGNAGITVYLEGTDRISYTDDTGSYVLAAVVPGSYVLGAATGGFISQRVTALTATAGADTAVPVVNLLPFTASNGPTGLVKTRVQLSGAATGNAGITVFLSGTSFIGYTDDAGDVTIQGVLPGTYELAALRVGFDRGSVAGVAVSAGQTTTLPAFSLSPAVVGGGPGTIAGSVRLLGATNHSAIQVALSGGALATPLTTTAASSGSYQFTNVPTGVYQLAYTATGFQAAQVGNVLAAPGAFRVQDVTLYRGRRLDPRPHTTTGLVAPSNTVVFSYQDGPDPATWLYSPAADTFTPTLTRQGRLLARNAAGTFGTVSVGSYSSTELFRVNLLTGAANQVLPLVGPGSGAWGLGVEPRFSVFTDASGSTRYVAADSTTAGLVAAKPCANSDVYPQQTLPYGTGTWVSTSGALRCDGSYVPVGGLLELESGQGAPLAKVVRYGPEPRQTAVTLEPEAPATASTSPSVLKRLNFTAPSVTVLQTGVTDLFVAPDYSYGRVNYALNATTTRYSVGRFNPASGAVTELVNDATLVLSFAGGRRALAGVGAAVNLSELQFDTGTVTPLCSAAKGYAVSDDDRYVFCVTGAGPYTLTAFDRVALTQQTVTTSASGTQVWASGDSVLWLEAPGLRGKSLTQAGGPYTLCSGTATTTLLNQGLWVGKCVGTDERWLVGTVATGVTRELLPGANTSSGASIYLGGQHLVTPNARGVVVQYYASPYSSPTGWSCGLSISNCAVLFDVATGTRTVVPGTSYYTPVASSSGRSVVVSGGSSLVFGRFTGTGAPSTAVYPGFSGNAGTRFSTSDRYAMLSNGYLLDSQTGTIDTTCNSAVVQLGTSSEYFCNLGAAPVVVKLEQGIVTAPLGTTVQSAVAAGDSVYFLDGSTLRRYQAGAGITTMAPNASTISSPQGYQLYLTDFSGASGTLRSLNLATGALATVISAIGSRMVALSGTQFFVFKNPTASAGDLFLLDVATGSVIDLAARARLGTSFQLGRTTRVAFSGEDGAGAAGLFVAKLDGTSTRQVGGDSSTYWFSADASRLFYTLNGLLWSEDPAGGPSIAIDAAIAATTMTPDGRFIFYSLSTLNYPDSLRNGTYRIDLP